MAIQDAMGWLDCHLHEFRVLDPDEQRIVSIGIPTDDDRIRAIALFRPGVLVHAEQMIQLRKASLTASHFTRPSASFVAGTPIQSHRLAT